MKFKYLFTYQAVTTPTSSHSPKPSPFFPHLFCKELVPWLPFFSVQVPQIYNAQKHSLLLNQGANAFLL